jgi:hypothetical protein
MARNGLLAKRSTDDPRGRSDPKGVILAVEGALAGAASRVVIASIRQGVLFDLSALWSTR